MSIQQEWELAYSKDPKGFDELPGSEKADIIRRFVQAKGAKYGGGKSPQVSQFLESKLNEYQPVAGASQGRISRAIEGLMAGVKAPAGGSIITEAVGGQQDLPGLFDIIDLNKGFQAASLARGGGFEAPVTPKKLEKIATQGEPSAPFIAPDPYYMGGAMVGMAPETTAEALIGGKVGVEAAKRLPYTGEIARRAVQFGAGALTGPIIPGAATGLGVAIAPEERRENVIQMGKEGMLYGSLLSGLGGAAMPGPKPQLPTNPVPRVNLLTPEMAAGAKEAQPVKAAMLKRAAKKAEGQLSKEGAYAVTGITSRQEAEALAREANRVTPYASSGGAFEVRERVGPKGKIIYSVEPFRNEDPYILNSYLNEATQNIRRAASAGPAAAPKGKMSAQITTRPARPMPEVNLAPGARTTPPSAVGARDVTIRPRTPEEYAQLLDITGPSSIPTRGQEAALAAARAGAPAEAAAAEARRAAASIQSQHELDQLFAGPEITQPRAQVAPPPPTQGRVRPEATEELFGPLTQEQAAARQLMQEEADAVEAALRAGQTIPVEQPPAPTGMMRQRAPGRTVDISGRTGTAGATLPGGRRAAAPMRAAAAEVPAPAPRTSAVEPQTQPPKQKTFSDESIRAIKNALDDARVDTAATAQRFGDQSPEYAAAIKKESDLSAAYNNMLGTAAKDAEVAAAPTKVPAPEPAPTKPAAKAKTAKPAAKPKKAAPEPVAPAAEAPPAPKGKMSKGAKAAEVTPPPPPAPAPTKRAPSKKKEVAQAEAAPPTPTKPQAEIQFSGTLKDRKTKQSYETVTRQVEDPLGRVPGATKVDTDGRLELRSSDGKTWSVEKPQFSKADFNQINPIGRKTLESGLTKTQARKYAQDYLEGKTPAPKKPAGETTVIGGAKAGEAKTKGARRGAIGTGEKENGKKLIHKEGGEPTDSAVVRFVKGEDGFFNAKKLGESIVKGIGFGVTGVREIIAVAARLIQKIAGDGFRAGFKKAAAGVTRTRAYTAVARTLPRLGDIIETGGQNLIIKPMNYTGDLLVDIASRGKGPDSRKFMRQVGEVLRRDRELNVEAVKRILRTPANTESVVFNGLSNAVRRFAIGEFGLSKSMIDMIQSIEDEVLKDLKELLEYTGRLLAKYKDDEDALIQIGKDIEDANYTGNNTDVLEGKRIIGNISKSLLDVGAITQGAYDAYVKDGMSSYLPRIYRKWLKANEDRSGMSIMFFREVNKDPGLTGYEHRGTTEVMSRRKLNEELAKGVQWRELGRTKQSTEDIARAQKAFDKAEKALEKAEDAVKEAKKNRDRINRIAPLPDGSDAAALRTRKTMAAQKLSVSQERLRIAKRNVEKTKNKLESYDLNERVTVVRDWTEDEMNKWAREWNPIPSMVKLYDTALRDLKNGRMFEYLRTGSDDMGRYSMTPEELGVPTDVKYKIPKQVVDDSGKRWVYLDPDKIAKGGTVARYGKLGGNYVRDDIASYLLFHNQFGNFRRLVSMAKQYTGMNAWKAMKTVWSTTYYINNFFNASPNVELAGGSVTDLPAAFKDIVEDAAIIKMLEDANIIKQGKLARELAASAQSVLKKGLEADGVVTHFTASNALQKAGTQLAKTRESLQLVSQATDDLWRVTLYKGLIERQGLSHADAIKIVRDAIYDSKRVTSPLADAAEIFVPFARSSAWMLDQLVTNSIRNPHKLAYLMAIGKFVPWAATTLAIVAGGSTKEQIAAEEESIEDYLKDAKWPIGWPTKIRLFSDSTGKAYYWDTKNFGGLHTMAAEVGNTGFGYLPQSLGPGGPWWIFLQAVMNKDMYRGEDIRKRDTFKRDITIDSELISSPMSEFLVSGLGPSGAPAAYKLARSMLGMPEPSGKMISSVTRLLQMGGIKIREVDPEIQIPRSIEKGESAIGQWRAERNKDFRVLLKMEKEGAPESARLKQEERVNRWDAKIEELSREEMERALKLQEGLP